MTHQFAHNVTPGPRHLSAQGVPAATAGPFSGPEFERNARALVSLVEMYANGIKASGNVPAGITAEDLKMLPVARLQELYYATPLKPPTANAGMTLGDRHVDPYASYPDNPGTEQGGRYEFNSSTPLDADVIKLCIEVKRLVRVVSFDVLASHGVARLEALRKHLDEEWASRLT